MTRLLGCVIDDCCIIALAKTGYSMRTKAGYPRKKRKSENSNNIFVPFSDLPKTEK